MIDNAKQVANEETGLESLGENDYVIPRITIGQVDTPGIPPEEVGKYRNNVSNESFDSLEMVALVVKKSRLLMPEDYDPDNKPMCGSIDFEYPDESFVQTEGLSGPQAANCSACSMSKWGKKSNGKPKPPRCYEIVNILTMDLTEGDRCYSACWQSFKSSALTPVRKYLSSLAMGVKMKRGKNIWSFVTRQTITELKGDKKVYIPSFGPARIISGEQLKIADVARQEMRLIPVQTDLRHDAVDIDAGKEF